MGVLVLINLLWFLYLIFAEGKSEQIYLLATTPFLPQTENRRLNTYIIFIFYLYFIYVLSNFVIDFRSFSEQQQQQQQILKRPRNRLKTKQNTDKWEKN